MDDRPRADVRVLAAGFFQLRLCPRSGVEARLIGDRIVYPAEASEQGACYFIAHELGHEVAIDAGCAPQVEEWVASRIGAALMLPRAAYLRDLADVGWNLGKLCALWPLVSPWIHARRIAELAEGGAVASRWTRAGCVSRVITDGEVLPRVVTPLERSLALAAMRGARVATARRTRAWPTADGAIVMCGAREIRARLARAV